ncbi:MAG: sugar transferase, partial [Pseudomonadota bacterium]
MSSTDDGLAMRQREGVIASYGAALVHACRFLDTVLIVLVFVATMSTVVNTPDARWFSDRPVWLDALICILVLQFMGSFFRLDRSWRMIRLRFEVLELFGYWLASFVMLLALFAFTGDLLLAEWRTWFQAAALWFAISFLAMVGARGVVRMALRHYRARGNDVRVVVIVGSGVASKKLAATFEMQPWMGISVAGVFDDQRDAEVAGSIDDAVELSLTGQVSAIYLALPLSAHDKVKSVINRLAGSTVSIYYCPPVSDLGYVSSRYDDVFGQPVLSIVDSPFEGFSGAVKRIEDLVICAIAAPILIVPSLLCAVAIKLTSPGPVFFKQTRYGLD